MLNSGGPMSGITQQLKFGRGTDSGKYLCSAGLKCNKQTWTTTKKRAKKNAHTEMHAHCSHRRFQPKNNGFMTGHKTTRIFKRDKRVPAMQTRKAHWLSTFDHSSNAHLSLPCKGKIYFRYCHHATTNFLCHSTRKLEKILQTCKA